MTDNPTKVRNYLILLVLALLISALSHSVNMFNYPYYENDEGVYMSQAWSLITMGKLSPYTYWYDHAPAGWIFIALWNLLTGGFFTFGFSINSGRVFMMILHVLCTFFLFRITHILTKSNSISFISSVIYALSPLGIYFHRRVLLDNIMIFWVLWSVLLALNYKKRLRYILASGLAFGIGILTKENAIFFIPAIIFILYHETHMRHKSFALVSWLTLAMVITSMYFLYALIKGELFPTGTFLGGQQEHVSLIGTLKEQYSREGGGIMDPEKSAFWNSFRVWVELDPIIIYVGIVATIINVLLAFKYYVAKVAALLSLSMWIFLMRGGLVIEFYIVPLLPFLALNISVVIWYAVVLLKKFHLTAKYVPNVFVSLTAILFGYLALHNSTNARSVQNVYTFNQTQPQVDAVNWILTQDTPNAFYVIDNYGYIDLQTKGKNRSFQNAEWYWKVDRDPKVIKGMLNNQPNGIDFIALTPQMEHDITTAGLDITLEAWHNSKPYKRFWQDGWGVELWATNYPSRVLSSTWQSYKKHFIKNGRVLDPYNLGVTTSEAQSYALLRAVYMNDSAVFNEVYKWTKDNLQQPSKLFAWKYENNGKIDQGTASDADQDIALSLLFAYKTWEEPFYLNEAKEILNGIWQNEVVNVNNKHYLTAANWANHSDAITLNPSYLSPAYYKIFAAADTSHPWAELVDTSYEILDRCTKAPLDKEAGLLPPEWCSLNKETLEFTKPGEFQPQATEYGYNAFRVPFRVAMDYQWHKNPQAKTYLESLEILNQEYADDKIVHVAYQHDGTPWETYESVAAYSGNLGYYMVTKPDIANEVYQSKIMNKLYEDGNQSYWEDPDNYYTQNLAWFSTALYTNNLPNLWFNGN